MHYPLGLTRFQRQALVGRGGTEEGWSPRGADAGLGPVDQLAFDTQEYEFGVRLPELLLMRIDRFSMANGVEARTPFLDPELIRFAYRLPPRLKLRDGETKVALRRAVADLVPPHVLQRPKQGFGAPISRWFGARMGSFFEVLMREEALQRYFDCDVLSSVLASHVSGQRRNEFVLWPILNFALWHRYWIEGKRSDAFGLPAATHASATRTVANACTGR
jgi:asparagine synthase (glutamine-hydrolysing)